MGNCEGCGFCKASDDVSEISKMAKNSYEYLSHGNLAAGVLTQSKYFSPLPLTFNLIP